MSTTEKHRNRLITLLKELFQLDQPELDFGLYKIMHAKSVQITKFLESDLLKEIEQAFGEKDSVDAGQMKAQAIARLKESLGEEALDDKGNLQDAFRKIPAGKKYLEEIAAAEAAKDTLNAESEIYDHLYRFFERYYDNGDFMSRRYYARESDARAAPFSVPYDGREVYLHWANKDQYYIKSSEYLSNYTFELNEAIRQEAERQKGLKGKGQGFDFGAMISDKPLKIHCRIVDASEGEHGNIKAAGDQKRFFIIHTDNPIELVGAQFIAPENGSSDKTAPELVIQFQYRTDSEKTGQDNTWQQARLQQAEAAILEALKALGQADKSAAAFLQGLQLPAPTDSKDKRTLLGKYLQKYAARNTMDYFIHKDLGGFMRRELDFYIKNEIMRLDDIENAEAPKVEQYLSRIRVLRKIAHQLIAFLAQLEDFQKKLWLKKKFVTETNYCITLDRVPEKFYAEIAANPQQWEQWEKLGMLETPSLETPSPLRGEGWGEGLGEGKTLGGEGENAKQIKTRTQEERSEILQTFAKEMRQAPTDAEARMWYFLRNRRLGNWKFRRQHAIAKYIVDFICVDAGLVIELDGGQHADLLAEQADEERSAFLAERGLRVLRFWNNDFLKETDVVLEQILLALDETSSHPDAPHLSAPHPSPLPGGEREQNNPQPKALSPPGRGLGEGQSSPPGRGLGEGQSSPPGRGLGEGQLEYLKAHPYLMADTALFDDTFKQRLLAEIPDLDAQCDGVLVHSENFQALGLMQEKYREQVKCIYIDPPYNTGGDGFPYKDSYKHSSWASFMFDRLIAGREMLSDSGLFFSSIDFVEESKLRVISDAVFSDDNFLSKIVWEKRFTRSNNAKLFSTLTESILAYRKSGLTTDLKEPRNEKADSTFSNPDNDFRGVWTSVSYVNPATKEARKKLSYPLLNPITGMEVTHPTNAWKYEKSTYEKHVSENRLYWGVSGGHSYPRLKRFLSEIEGMVPVDLWKHGDTGTTDSASKLLEDEFGKKVFEFPKPPSLIRRVVSLAGFGSNSGVFMDYFAGTAPTAHAVINLNREDNGKRKYILVEQNNYFDTVLKPRIQKVIYSKDWKEGKPVSREGISHCFKYLRLESYEDALNNLLLKTDSSRDAALEKNPAMQRDYLLNYFLDVETQGSQSLLNIADFRDPTAYRMQIKKPGSEEQVLQNIDLIETFNWLIGLWVQHIGAPHSFSAEFEREQDADLPPTINEAHQNTRLLCKRLKPDASGAYWFRLIEGYTLKVPGDDTSKVPTLIVWRKQTDDAEKDNAVLQKFLMEKLQISPREQTYCVIYINGSHTLPNPVVEGEQTKVRLIEEAFHTAMWAGEAS